jgi:heme/copper-type cytochrome/quinol oxidase subunit 1
MTTVDPHVTGAGAVAGTGVRADGIVAVVADWITSTDHKRIGRMFMGTALLVLLATAVIGALLGFERVDATADAFDSGALPQLFWLYRIGLTLGAVVPLGLGLAIAVVPLQLGARALAFPRVAAMGFFTWLVGIGLVIGSIVANGGPAGGDSDMVDLFLGGLVLTAVGLTAAAGSLAVSVLTTRAPGMNMRRVPLFAWSALVQSLGLVLAMPVLVGTTVLVWVDHAYSRSTFGGNLGVGSWIGFAFTQPATILYAVPVAGLVLDAAATATRRRPAMRGLGLIGIGLVSTGFLGGVAQVDAPLPRDIVDKTFGEALEDIVPWAVLHLLPLLGGVVVLAALGAILRNRPRVFAPMVFGVLALLMLLAGIAGNVLYQIGDAQLTGTVFEEGVWVYLSYATVLAVMGGVVYWGPKLWGRTIDAKKAIPLALLGTLGTVLASLPYYVAGFAKQPGGVTQFDYDGPQDLWNALAGIGHALVALTVLAFVGLAISSFRSGPLAGDDPFDGQTLEWATTSPAPPGNFVDVHAIASAEPLLDLKPARDGGTA